MVDLKFPFSVSTYPPVFLRTLIFKKIPFRVLFRDYTENNTRKGILLLLYFTIEPATMLAINERRRTTLPLSAGWTALVSRITAVSV